MEDVHVQDHLHTQSAETPSETNSKVEILHETKKGKARSDMTVEERIRAADERKTKGNVLFKDEKLEEAMHQYEMAISYMGSNVMVQLSGKYRSMALDVKNPCHLNMAACLIKLKRYEEAIVQCSIVLAEDEANIKALFRRGKAKAELGQTDVAREDFLTARKYAPEEKAITKELHLLAEQEKAFKQKQKEFYKGIFGPSPETKEMLSEQMIDEISEQKSESAMGPQLKRRWQRLQCKSFTLDSNLQIENDSNLQIENDSNLEIENKKDV
ncbi:Tetratricopeptide repeat-containing domain [Macleaya cordata]|uniref:Tetratricopeptide repeat-containing domain n=1 Tax=Macleaya cordata TaxID=56857 RepID=A0A200R9L4_MACCD|nr:Tetratricopeptide repeat-containing domain [Macleaya cordata]